MRPHVHSSPAPARGMLAPGQDLALRRERATLPAASGTVSSAKNAAGPAFPSESPRWFYQGAQDLAREGHWSGVRGLVKDRWDWFTSKCGSFRAPQESARRQCVRLENVGSGRLFRLLQDRSAPGTSGGSTGCLWWTAASRQRSAMQSEAWTTMHNFPRRRRVATPPLLTQAGASLEPARGRAGWRRT